ncbi:Dynactin subunit 2 [Trichoplax sp. H2]|uniref:Dynactin subunit 2 n=1 Tax=Trichoplax adhaerens TaxID=10228 RepID=B3RTA3_TRIAD|nr:hypothetical protein TRIADDRAFT_54892 [Trichoplax adhaerens]EDV27193.1 hypothetical protein TRIADDRAFT_54892 [Trichoplax adhaerens]RDD40959.1 Dynactin subunit 2 [Trichoplax sp. H2]|eukprot:XP_002111189.1 hypothetical protein TRIADDRAFT_54892 [Trichoplax adhaerens]
MATNTGTSGSSKYGGIEGIDNQPDVFETGGEPTKEKEKEKGKEKEMKGGIESKTVELIPMNAQASYEQFKDKYIDSKDADFTDSIKDGRNIGYDTTEYELAGDETETPLQKYQRLKIEISQFTEEIDKIKATMTEEADINPVELSKHVKILQKQLLDTNIEDLANVDVKGDSDISKKLLAQIEAFKGGNKPAKASASSGDKSNTDYITYQLYYRPEQAKFNVLSKAAEVEQKLQKLEQIVGKDSRRLPAITSDLDPNNKSLAAAIYALQAKFSLLDSAKIEHVDARLQAVLQRINEIAEKTEGIDKAEEKSKVSEIYDFMSKWDAIASSIPDITARLQTLKSLHHQASTFAINLAGFSNAQDQISNALQSQAKVLRQVQESLVKNMTVMQSNVSSIESRIATCESKLRS